MQTKKLRFDFDFRCLSVPEFGFYGLKTKRRVDCSRLNVMASNPRGCFIKKLAYCFAVAVVVELPQVMMYEVPELRPSAVMSIAPP